MKIDLGEEFPKLGRPPIVEAVLSVWARPGRSGDLSQIVEQFEEGASDYSVAMFPVAAAGKALEEEDSWVRLESDDGKRSINVRKGVYEFHWVGGYKTWDFFSMAALEMWRVYRGVTEPPEIQRMSVRFVNRLDLPEGETRFEGYLEGPPEPPRGLELPFVGYFHRDQFLVPEQPYTVRILRTIEAPTGTVGSWRIIVDVEVSTIGPMSTADAAVKSRLPDMQWLKNKAFFGSVTGKAIELCR
ncbi:MAG TPA: TIGR04255 family protein [Phycisphaerae bacterium]|nr:TIGR04255 family protein [Phycisphaerae bacterium]